MCVDVDLHMEAYRVVANDVAHYRRLPDRDPQESLTYLEGLDHKRLEDDLRQAVRTQEVNALKGVVGESAANTAAGVAVDAFLAQATCQRNPNKRATKKPCA